MVENAIIDVLALTWELIYRSMIKFESHWSARLPSYR